MPPQQSLAASLRKWKLTVAGHAKGLLRRQGDTFLPKREIREYQSWMAERRACRQLIYSSPTPPGLLSILTAVWDGSPVRYLKKLARSIQKQNSSGACEWVLLDNGCTNSKILKCLDELRTNPWIKLIRAETNSGIMRGQRQCLEAASGRYVLPVDADDVLYDDALLIIASWIIENDHPPLLYTDEDKAIGARRYQPYLKPDWDPVLLLNSAYIAHLGVIDRKKALELDAYSDASAEGSPDWDLFVRFLLAGYAAVHIPEVVYSWRVHASSTADDAANKSYILSSQRKVLQRFLDARSATGDFAIERSSLFGTAAHWHFIRRAKSSKAFPSVVLTAPADTSAAMKKEIPMSVVRCRDEPNQALTGLLSGLKESDAWVHFIGADVEIDSQNWQQEVSSIVDLHADVVMIGGRIKSRDGTIREAGRCFGVNGLWGSPYRGAISDDPGYFGQIWKQRSTSAVSTQFAVMRVRFLLELLGHVPPEASLAFLGAWAGAYALKTSRRVVYSPFLGGWSDTDWDGTVSEAEQELFHAIHADVIPDHRFYPQALSLERPFRLGDPTRIPSPAKTLPPFTAPRS